MNYDDLCRYNPALVRSVACLPQRAKFYEHYGEKPFFVLVENLCREVDKVSYYDKIKWHLRRVYRFIFK